MMEPLYRRISGHFGKDKAARLEELESKGAMGLTEKEGLEHAALILEIVDQKEALEEPKQSFEGKCRRCGREFDNSVPKVNYAKGVYEIASREWCADCNAIVMSVTFRESSAYRLSPGRLFDPTKGGRGHASS